MEHAGTFHKYSLKSLFGQNAAADMPFFILVLTLLCFGPIASAVPSFTSDIKGDVGLSSAVNSFSIVISIFCIVGLLLVIL